MPISYLLILTCTPTSSLPQSGPSRPHLVLLMPLSLNTSVVAAVASSNSFLPDKLVPASPDYPPYSRLSSSYSGLHTSLAHYVQVSDFHGPNCQSRQAEYVPQVVDHSRRLESQSIPSAADFQGGNVLCRAYLRVGQSPFRLVDGQLSSKNCDCSWVDMRRTASWRGSRSRCLYSSREVDDLTEVLCLACDGEGSIRWR